jgi:ATP-dependent Clp protease ATP-binding subunit ClpC
MFYGNLGVTPEQIRRQTRRVLQEALRIYPAGCGETQTPDVRNKPGQRLLWLTNLQLILTGMAEEGKLDPVIGRQMEIERVIQILARRNKNNPALIGEPGVGKTAIVEGLAQRIIDGDVPEPLLNRRLLNWMWAQPGRRHYVSRPI